MKHYRIKYTSKNKPTNRHQQGPTHSRWLWGVRLRKHNVGAPSWGSKTPGLRGKCEGIPEGRADAEANECPKAICENSLKRSYQLTNTRCSTHSRWLWGVRLRKHNVKAPSWRSMTTGMRGGETRESRRDAATLKQMNAPKLSAN